MDTRQQQLLFLTSAAVFALVASLWIIVVLLVELHRHLERRRVERRLGLVQKSEEGHTRVLHLWRDGKATTTTVPDKPKRGARAVQVYNELGWSVPLSTVILGTLGSAALATALATAFSEDYLVGLLAGLACVLVPYLYVRREIARHTERFERQFVDALGLATRSLRAGHPLLGAFQLVAGETEPPVSLVFGAICQKQALGLSLSEALTEVADNSSSGDLKLFAASVVIQLRSGGNLADMMDRLADVVRDRIRVHRKARVLVAQTQLSKRILLAMPFVLFCVIYFVNKGYLEPLYTTTAGRLMILGGMMSMLVGAWVMGRIAVVKY